MRNKFRGKNQRGRTGFLKKGIEKKDKFNASKKENEDKEEKEEE